LKYLIAGLGNIGEEYTFTRHNIGFIILDALARASNVVFEDKRYGFISRATVRGRTLLLLKPSTFMNLSGRAVNYWLTKEKIPLSNLLVLVDDVSLPFGQLRLRARGSNAGHNGLFSIQSILGTQDYARLRFGIGDDYRYGQKINYVLGRFTKEEEAILPQRIDESLEVIRSFAFLGVERTMTLFNKKPGEDAGKK
jgi:PTH1 family peptidyl-tRNA hydrolase